MTRASKAPPRPEARTAAADRFASGAGPVLAILVFLVPLYFDLGLEDAFDLPKMTLAYLGTIVLVGFWAWVRGERWGPWRFSGLEAPLAAFVLVLTAAAWTSIDRSRSF